MDSTHQILETARRIHANGHMSHETLLNIIIILGSDDTRVLSILVIDDNETKKNLAIARLKELVSERRSNANFI